jgi:mannose-6-phosphate isomerase-like protein (cupin superfamily)
MKEQSVRRLTLSGLKYNDSRLMPEYFRWRRIASGGLYVFEPGETAHPEPRHVHEVDEVFIFVQGQGVIPIDGREYPVQTGDVVIVEAGEDHHTRSSVHDPLVAAWYLMEPS